MMQSVTDRAKFMSACYTVHSWLQFSLNFVNTKKIKPAKASFIPENTISKCTVCILTAIR